MMTTKAPSHRVIEIDWPEFGQASYPPQSPASEFEKRIDNLRAMMGKQKLTHLVVDGDREHFANLAFLTGFDPRFEEALLILSPAGNPLLVVGNECESYVDVSPLFGCGKLRRERFQPFSVLNQPRDHSRIIREIFAGEGITATSRVGCVGWKYFSDAEHPEASYAIDIPAYLADTLRTLAGREGVVNSTDLLVHPGYGLRTFCSPSEIAYFEYTAVQASEAVKRMIFGMREGMTDHAVVEQGRLCGEPLGCHVTLATGRNALLGLSSPTGQVIERGKPLSLSISYWGSNTCRAGWVASSFRDLPNAAADYIANFAGPYFEALGQWFALLKPGTPGGRISSLIQERLPFERFGIFINPGHLIHLDGGLVLRFSPAWRCRSIRAWQSRWTSFPHRRCISQPAWKMESFWPIEELRKKLHEAFPDCYARCQKRRSFMKDVLGIELPEEVLPLSNVPAIVPPFFLAPNSVLALEV